MCWRCSVGCDRAPWSIFVLLRGVAMGERRWLRVEDERKMYGWMLRGVSVGVELDGLSVRHDDSCYRIVLSDGMVCQVCERC